MSSHNFCEFVRDLPEGPAIGVRMVLSVTDYKEWGKISVSKNFNLNEFACKHCGEVKLHPKLLNLLQELRERLGVPLWFTSAYRCETHNKAVRGAKKSQHLYGTAVDIPVYITGLSYDELFELVKEIGFTGIGVNPAKGFIHVDVREGDLVVFDY